MAKRSMHKFMAAVPDDHPSKLVGVSNSVDVDGKLYTITSEIKMGEVNLTQPLCQWEESAVNKSPAWRDNDEVIYMPDGRAECQCGFNPSGACIYGCFN